MKPLMTPVVISSGVGESRMYLVLHRREQLDFRRVGTDGASEKPSGEVTGPKHQIEQCSMHR